MGLLSNPETLVRIGKRKNQILCILLPSKEFKLKDFPGVKTPEEREQEQPELLPAHLAHDALKLNIFKVQRLFINTCVAFCPSKVLLLFYIYIFIEILLVGGSEQKL